MSARRDPLPQFNGTPFLADGGLETWLVFHDGVELPAFAAFPLLASEDGRQRLRRYFEPFLRLAAERRTGFVLDTPTWRANPDWGRQLGWDADRLSAINRAAAAFAIELRETSDRGTKVVINGVIGPRGDGYRVEVTMTAEEARAYHAPQVEALRDGGAEMVSALTMTYAEEAIGVARAADAAGLPCVVSFTVETDGKLPSGQTLRAAIEQLEQETDGAPAYYMINCAHPTHFADAIADPGPWLDRIGGVRANASRQSHAELDAATALDSGDPEELARQYRFLRVQLPRLAVLGGCCGTDLRHVRAICEACL